MSTDNRQWCWLSSRDSEEAWGPFTTREATISAAVECGRDAECGETIVLSRCNFPDPGAAAPHIVGDLLDLVEEGACEDEKNGDGPTFAYVDGANEDGLRTVVADWLRANVKAVWFSVDPDAFDEVKLP